MKDCKNFFKVFSFYLGLDLVLLGFILSLVLLGVVDHLLDVLLVLGELGGAGLVLHEVINDNDNDNDNDNNYLHEVITVRALPGGVVVKGPEGQQGAVLALGAVHPRHHRPQLSPVLEQKCFRLRLSDEVS